MISTGLVTENNSISAALPVSNIAVQLATASSDRHSDPVTVAALPVGDSIQRHHGEEEDQEPAIPQP